LDAEEMLGMVVSGKSLFFEAFLPGNNFGLIIPILIAIIVCKDFSHGTIRNKIIMGKSRSSIFLSMFISSAIIMFGVILAHALLTLGISLIFFDFQADPFTASDLGYMIISVFLEMLVYVFISAIVSFLIVAMKNAGLSIVMYVAVNFIFTIIGGIVQIAAMFSDPTSSSYKILEFLQKSNVFMSTLIGSGSSYKFVEILYILIPTILGSFLVLLLGNLIFNKKDLK
jgi:ABC-type transport system involved in multi-copper enzyme maturation permease subunit